MIAAAMSNVIIALAVTGLLLVVVEMFIPGMIVGASGALALVAAIVLSYLNYGARVGTTMVIATGFVSIALFLWWMGYFPRSYFGRKITLAAHSAGAVTGSNLPVLVGSEGKALTMLRPSGVALIERRRVDVVSEGPAIEAEQPVRVLRVEGTKVVVRRCGEI